MNTKRNKQSGLSLLFAVMAVWGGNVHAEGIDLDPISEGLSEVQKGVQSAQQATDAVKTGAAVVEGAGSTAVQGSLTDTLVNKLGVSTQQAQGGAGAIFQQAQGKLDSEQFASLSQAVPEMDTLLGAVPESSSSVTGLTGGVLGDQAGEYGNLAGLASTFSELNLSPDMVNQFVPVVVDYVRNSGGSAVANMLQSSLLGM